MVENKGKILIVDDIFDERGNLIVGDLGKYFNISDLRRVLASEAFDLEIRREDTGDYDLGKYIAVISDLGYPTDYRPSRDDVLRQLKKRGSEVRDVLRHFTKANQELRLHTIQMCGPILEELFGDDVFLDSLHTNDTEEYSWEEARRLYKDEERFPDIRGLSPLEACIGKRFCNMGEHSLPPRMGWYPLAEAAREQGRKVTFYTHDAGHSNLNLVYGIITGHFTPEEVCDVVQQYGPPLIPIVSSSKRLIVGDKRLLTNWMRVICEALDYQREQ